MENTAEFFLLPKMPREKDVLNGWRAFPTKAEGMVLSGLSIKKSVKIREIRGFSF